jgi:hypothetical protein
MSWIILAVVVAGVVALRGLLDSHGAALHVWRQVAISRGGVYLDHPERPAIEVDVGEARVRLEGNLGPEGTQDNVMTCRASYLVPLGPEFRVTAGGVGPLGKLLGARDLVLGVDREFDECFLVETDEGSAVRRTWSPKAMRLMHRELREARVRSNGREIEIVRGVIHSPAVMNAMIDVVGELASADLFGFEALRTLPGATYHPPTGPWNERSTPYAIIEQPVPVTLMPVAVRGRALTRATVGDGPRAQRIEITVREDGSMEPADGVAQMPPAAAALLDRLGEGTLVIDGADTSFTWRTVETNAERLLAAARLLAMLAGGPSLGAYR